MASHPAVVPAHQPAICRLVLGRSTSGDGRSLGSSLTNKVLWIGFSVPAAVAVTAWLHSIWPNVPTAEVQELDLGRRFSGMGLPWNVLASSGMHMSITFPLIGVFCLLPGEISLSLWLFYVLYRLQQLVWASFGVAEGGSASLSFSSQTFIGMEEAGGFIALSAVVLHQSRHTLRTAWRGIISRVRPEPDAYSPLAGHWALLGFILANAFMLWWGIQTGMPWWPFILIMGLFYTVLIGVSRLVTAAGLTHVDTGVFPRQVILRTIGAAPVGPVSLTVFAYFSTSYMYDPRIALIAQAMNSFKLLHTGRIETKRFSLAACLAVVTMLAVGFPTMLWIAYHYSALALPDWPVAAPARDVFDELDSSLHSPELADSWLRAALAMGTACMFGLIAMHSRFVWWPVHPVGFLIASSWSTNSFVWSNAFIAWTISTVIRRYGGLKLYRWLRPAFIGLVLGGYVPEGALALVSAILGLHPPR